MIEEKAEEQQKNSKVPVQLQPYMYKKGQSGNPSGRPKGISMKEYLKMKFASMTDDERELFMEGINKLDLLKMAEGNPESKSEVNNTGNPIIVLSNEIASKHDTPSSPSDNS